MAPPVSRRGFPVPDPMLEIANLSKRYGETVALDGASIAFAAGTVHTIIGENGSGKSTLVKLLSGIVTPDRGEIRVDGTPFAGRNPPDFQARGFATVFQEVLVAPARTVTDNVLLGYDGIVGRRIPRDVQFRHPLTLFARLRRLQAPEGGRFGQTVNYQLTGTAFPSS